MDKIEQAREALLLYDLYDQMPADRGGKNGPKGRAYQAFLDAKTKALSPTTPVDGVGAEPHVKPLEWEPARFSDQWERFTALSVFGYYEALEWSDSTFGGSFPADARDDDGAPTEFRAASIDEAKAAAQADYEARILSALASPEAEARLRERWTQDAIDNAPENLRRLGEMLSNKLDADEWNNAEPLLVSVAARLAQAEGGPAVTEAWQPIESAPRDGTTIDLWHEEFGRHTDHYWGVPSHECGEAGSFCDSDWHSTSEGWVDGTFNSIWDEPQGFTHWMPHPKPPAALHPKSAAGEEGKP